MEIGCHPAGLEIPATRSCVAGGGMLRQSHSTNPPQGTHGQPCQPTQQRQLAGFDPGSGIKKCSNHPPRHSRWRLIPPDLLTWGACLFQLLEQCSDAKNECRLGLQEFPRGQFEVREVEAAFTNLAGVVDGSLDVATPQCPPTLHQPLQRSGQARPR